MEAPGRRRIRTTGACPAGPVPTSRRTSRQGRMSRRHPDSRGEFDAECRREGRTSPTSQWRGTTRIRPPLSVTFGPPAAGRFEGTRHHTPQSPHREQLSATAARSPSDRTRHHVAGGRGSCCHARPYRLSGSGASAACEPQEALPATSPGTRSAGRSGLSVGAGQIWLDGGFDPREADDRDGQQHQERYQNRPASGTVAQVLVVDHDTDEHAE